MSRSTIILVAVTLACVALFAGAYLAASRVFSNQVSQSLDDLDWLRIEYRLTPSELEQVREVHEGYVTVCHGFCRQIAEQKGALKALVATGQGDSDAAAECLSSIAHLRAECQAAMLSHFEEVSELMPPDQGNRYLEEMRRITLGSHEQIEEAMSGSQGHGHDHH